MSAATKYELTVWEWRAMAMAMAGKRWKHMSGWVCTHAAQLSAKYRLRCMHCTMQMCTYAHVWMHAWYTAQTLRANWVENMSVTWFDVSRYAPKLLCPTLYCSTTCNTCCLTQHTGQQLWRVNTCCAAHRHCCGLLDMERSIWRMKYGFYSWDDTFICFGKANRSINLCSNQLNFLITTKDKDILLYMTTIEMTE